MSKHVHIYLVKVNINIFFLQTETICFLFLLSSHKYNAFDMLEKSAALDGCFDKKSLIKQAYIASCLLPIACCLLPTCLMAAERPSKAREAIHPASCMLTVLSHSVGGLGGGGGGGLESIPSFV
jgi:hypothetical protein